MVRCLGAALLLSFWGARVAHAENLRNTRDIDHVITVNAANHGQVTHVLPTGRVVSMD